MDRKRITSEKKNMRFKEFTNIDSLRHAKVDEKPVKFFNGDYKNLDIAPPPIKDFCEMFSIISRVLFSDLIPGVKPNCTSSAVCLNLFKVLSSTSILFFFAKALTFSTICFSSVNA